MEGFGDSFASPADFTPEVRRGRGAQVGRDGADLVAGAVAGGAVAVTIHSVEVVDARASSCTAATRGGSATVVGRETRGRGVPAQGGSLRFDDRTTLPTRPLIGCLADGAGRGRAPREAAGPLRRQPRLPRDPRRATVVLPVEHDGAGLYFGDCKALMGDGEIVNPPEVGALVTATADRASRPVVDGRGRASRPPTPDDARLGPPLEWSARQAFRELLELGGRGHGSPAAAGRPAARDGRGRRHLPDQQHRLHGVLRAAAGRARALSLGTPSIHAGCFDSLLAVSPRNVVHPGRPGRLELPEQTSNRRPG